MGHGWAPAQKAESTRASRSGCRSDVATTASVRPVHPDARDLRLGARPRHQAAWDADLDGLEADARPDHRRARCSRWATLDGAKVAGIADRTGSITPGKKADLVIIDGVGRERRTDHRPGRGGRLRRGHLERRHGHRRRRDPQARRQAASRDLSGPRKARRGVARLPAHASSAIPEPGWLPAKAATA